MPASCSILKSMDGKTRSAILDAFKETPYRLACSATPAPNDYMELGNHAEFVGVMTREEMLAMFFAHDGGDTSKWRLKGHAETVFWDWVCSWAITIRKPSDLGYDDGAFCLPPLDIHDRIVETPHELLTDAAGQVSLFRQQAQTLNDQRAVQRSSLENRVAAAVALANTPGQWIVWTMKARRWRRRLTGPSKSPAAIPTSTRNSLPSRFRRGGFASSCRRVRSSASG
jgi:hypothetical protein